MHATHPNITTMTMDKRLQLVQHLYGEADSSEPLTEDRKLRSEFEDLLAVKTVLDNLPISAAPNPALLANIMAHAKEAAQSTSGLSPEAALPVITLLYGQNHLPADVILKDEAHRKEYAQLSVAKAVLENPRERQQPKPEVLQNILQAAKTAQPRPHLRLLSLENRLIHQPIARWVVAASVVLVVIGGFFTLRPFMGIQEGLAGLDGQTMEIYEPPVSERVFSWDERPVYSTISQRMEHLEARVEDEWGNTPVPLEYTRNHSGNIRNGSSR